MSESNTYNELIKLSKLQNANSLSKISNNAHNSHDSLILHNLYKIVDILKLQTKNIKKLNEVLSDIRKFYNKKLRKEKSYILYYLYYIRRNPFDISINVIKYRNERMHILNMTETDILRLVWSAIGNNENLKNIFYENVSNLSNICLTGRIARMLTVFDGIINIKLDNKYIIRNEMMIKCSLVRENHYKNNYNDKYLKEHIENVLYNDYVKKNILTSNEFYEEINIWIDYI